MVCQGKTIKGTIEEFRTRLPLLLRRHGLPEGFIRRELELMNAYEVSKTDSKSMLGSINALKAVVRHVIRKTPVAEPVDRDRLEDRLINYPRREEKGKSLTSALKYLRSVGG